MQCKFSKIPFKVSQGVRINGEFAGQDGSIDFDEDSATVTCGKSATKRSYAVEQSGNQILVK